MTRLLYEYHTHMSMRIFLCEQLLKDFDPWLVLSLLFEIPGYGSLQGDNICLVQGVVRWPFMLPIHSIDVILM
jgi:hypothetical protein